MNSLFSDLSLNGYVSKYQKTVRRNFWQPQRSPFTAKSDIGTPAPTKLLFRAPPWYSGPGSNPCVPSLVSKVEKIIIFVNFESGFAYKCQKTVRCNFWQPQGSHFPANSNNGTPARTKYTFFVPP